jgi:hypothetical protein
MARSRPSPAVARRAVFAFVGTRQETLYRLGLGGEARARAIALAVPMRLLRRRPEVDQLELVDPAAHRGRKPTEMELYRRGFE